MIKSSSRPKRLLDRLEAVTAYKGYHENAVINYSKNNNIKLHKWPLENNKIINFDVGLVVSFGHLIPSWIIQSFPLQVFKKQIKPLPLERVITLFLIAEEWLTFMRVSCQSGEVQHQLSILWWTVTVTLESPSWKLCPRSKKLNPHNFPTTTTITNYVFCRFDVGEILSQKKVTINPDETQPELYQRLAKTGGELLIQGIEKLPDFIYSGKTQDDSEATYGRAFKIIWLL